MSKKEQTIPKSYEGMMMFTKGANVRNPYSGRSIYLNRVERSVYDGLMNTELCAEMFNNPKLYDIVEDGRRWFMENNIKAYSVLID